jgi:hypothetical protein
LLTFTWYVVTHPPTRCLLCGLVSTQECGQLRGGSGHLTEEYDRFFLLLLSSDWPVFTVYVVAYGPRAPEIHWKVGKESVVLFIAILGIRETSRPSLQPRRLEWSVSVFVSDMNAQIHKAHDRDGQSPFALCAILQPHKAFQKASLISAALAQPPCGPSAWRPQDVLWAQSEEWWFRPPLLLPPGDAAFSAIFHQIDQSFRQGSHLPFLQYFDLTLFSKSNAVSCRSADPVSRPWGIRVEQHLPSCAHCSTQTEWLNIHYADEETHMATCASCGWVRRTCTNIGAVLAGIDYFPFTIIRPVDPLQPPQSSVNFSYEPPVTST